jgi:UDP-N-acetylmuramoylalanine--D-glutamate ligase
VSALPLERPLVVGLAVTGAAMAGALARRGSDVVVVDDHPTDALRARADLLGVTLVESPSDEQLADLVATCTAVLPSPGIADRHPVFRLAHGAGVGVLSEFDLAQAWDDRPLLAITGTDGKTTVTTLVADMLAASGQRAVAAGNTEVPLVAAIDDPAAEVFVVEASSFRLGHTRHFHPQVGTWLNFAPDHLDVHATLHAYEAAKARVWAELGAEATAVANADDPVVVRNVVPANRTQTFSILPGADADYFDAGGALTAPDGTVLARHDELRRALPHDRANALAASASALAGGATLDGVRSALRTFVNLAHRVQLVGERAGVRWFDDSKATAPHATLAALAGFESAVLIAGGRNKGLDLAELGSAVGRLRAVVAIGEAAEQIAAVYEGHLPVATATSMAAAVEAAARLARRGDAVVLSPACASFDWYPSYAARGDDFTAEVRRQVLDGSRERP